jgi:hypothetical protein
MDCALYNSAVIIVDKDLHFVFSLTSPGAYIRGLEIIKAHGQCFCSDVLLDF